MAVADMQIAVLDRPRHKKLIAEIRAAGAGTRLLFNGDVAGGINAAQRDSRVDMCVGGTPESFITACAVKALGGLIQARLHPKDDAERGRALDAGHDLSRVLSTDDLVSGNNTYFVATGVTDGSLVAGVTRRNGLIRTESLVLRSHSGTQRRVVADHLESKSFGEES
jgi:fructose-1,6-bisphosphatase II